MCNRLGKVSLPVRMYACMYVCAFICMYVCMSVCLYVCIPFLFVCIARFVFLLFLFDKPEPIIGCLLQASWSTDISRLLVLRSTLRASLAAGVFFIHCISVHVDSPTDSTDTRSCSRCVDPRLRSDSTSSRHSVALCLTRSTMDTCTSSFLLLPSRLLPPYLVRTHHT